jgi:hypothetical protein
VEADVMASTKQSIDAKRAELVAAQYSAQRAESFERDGAWRKVSTIASELLHLELAAAQQRDRNAARAAAGAVPSPAIADEMHRERAALSPIAQAAWDRRHAQELLAREAKPQVAAQAGPSVATIAAAKTIRDEHDRLTKLNPMAASAFAARHSSALYDPEITAALSGTGQDGDR